MKKGLMGGTLRVLDEDQLQRIHNASIELLETHGMLSDSEITKDVFKEGGATVDEETGVITITEDMVNTALESAPSSFVLYGRDPKMDLLLEPGRVYYGMGGTSEPLFWDYDSGIPRQPTKEDMELNTRIGQAADNIDFIMSICSAADMPTETIHLHEYDALFRNTYKPIIYTSPGRWHTQMFLRMAVAASGGEEIFQERPCVVLFTQPVSPMQMSHYSEGMLDAAKYNVPIMASPGPMMGATSPTSLAGTLAQVNAEALMGVVMSQLVNPGNPVIYAPNTGVMDMATAQCTYGSSEQTLARAAVAQMGIYYGLPTFGMGGGSEAKLPDAEASSQAMMGMLLNGLAGLTLTQTLGTLGSGMYGSREMVLICDEIAHMVKRILRGIRVDDETLAVDVIKEVGHGGEFLSHMHTVNLFRDELFFPQLFKRQNIDKWKERGAKNITEVAHDQVAKILAERGPIGLPEGADSKLKEVLQQAVIEAPEMAAN